MLDGEVTLTPDEGEPVKIGEGDLIIFSEGIDFRWDVDQAVLMHYRFGH